MLLDTKNHYAELHNTRMAEAVCSSNGRHFHDEIKSMMCNKKGVSAVVDGACDAHEIADGFSKQYESLYNSVQYSNEDMERLLLDINGQTNLEPWTHFSVDEVHRAVKLLKPDKSDGHLGLYTDHIINGGVKLYTYICLLFNMMCKHAYTPKCLLMATIVPIPEPG